MQEWARAAWLAVLLVATVVPTSVAQLGDGRYLERQQPLVALMDFIWAERAQEGAALAIVDLGNRAVRVAPQSYAVHWRVARAYWWLAHEPGERTQRRVWAGSGADWARRAIRLDPRSVEGHYYETLNTGEYANLIGFPTALIEGVAGTIETSARNAYEIDATFDEGGPMIVLGRFYFLLPWPKRDLELSARFLEEVRQSVPANMVARVYLAETYRALGDEEKARGELLYVSRAGTTSVRKLADEKLREWFSS